MKRQVTVTYTDGTSEVIEFRSSHLTDGVILELDNVRIVLANVRKWEYAR